MIPTDLEWVEIYYGCYSAKFEGRTADGEVVHVVTLRFEKWPILDGVETQVCYAEDIGEFVQKYNAAMQQ
jgi:hypothetical protein